MHTCAHMRVGIPSLLQPVGLGAQTQVIRLDGRCLYLLSPTSLRFRMTFNSQ